MRGSERSEQASEQVRAAERASKASRVEQAQPVSGASERANRRASSPVLMSGFLVDMAHCAASGEPVRENRRWNFGVGLRAFSSLFDDAITP